MKKLLSSSEAISKIIAKYINGNVSVTILGDGTKIREWDDDIPVEIIHPESIDVKITNYCKHGCPFCHENSNIDGQHADLEVLLEKLNELPEGIELAIGGGNPLNHPQLYEFLITLKDMGFIPNITVNQKDLDDYHTFLLIKNLIENKLVFGVGISINAISALNTDRVKSLQAITQNIVFHLIIGISDFSFANKLVDEFDYCKILLLGYKNFGRGINYYNEKIDRNIKKWKKFLSVCLGIIHLSFDNLAIEQLELKKLLPVEKWNEFYMGEDFTFTMYIDAVNQEFAPTSRSNDKRRSFKDYSLIEYFQKFKNEINGKLK